MDNIFNHLGYNSVDIDELLKKRVKISPLKEAVYITLIYFLFGFNWILWSDLLLGFIIKDPVLYQKIQLIKGWLYVIVTAALIYILVMNRSKTIENTLKIIDENQKNLQDMLKELISTEEKLKDIIYYDSLTGLPSRLGLEIEIESLIKKNKAFALLHINFDNFNHINETLGHGVGDEFLIEMSVKMKALLTDSILGRFGADEFGIIVKDYKTVDNLKNLISETLKNSEKTWTKYNYDYFISFCVGISLYPEDGLNKTLILRNADLALKRAKKEGKSRLVFYSGEIFKHNSEIIKIKHQLEYALQKDEFILYFQPQYCLKTSNIKGMEVLLRWFGPEGAVPPDLFIPIAEESGQIYDIEKWVFKNSLAQKKEFEKMGFNDLDLSINLSSKTLMSNENFSDLIELLKGTEVDYSHIVFEITETDVISDINLAINQLLELKKFGVKIALDDFGTGYSSLNHLKKLPIDIIKLDKTFIKAIEENTADTFIIKSLLYLAIDLNYKVVAEGVETQAQFDFLNKYDCAYAQGYLMSRPLPISDIYGKLNK